MRLVSDPSIATKIRKMKDRMQWGNPLIQERGIDQTRFVLEDGQEENPEFSFLVIGDSGSGSHQGDNPQRRIAVEMLAHRPDCRFVLHTGDVIYMVGSSEFYYKNFINPYREFLVGGEHPKKIPYNQMVFNTPILPVLGNHDYYDLPLLFGLIAQSVRPLRRLLELKLDLDVGWHGSFQGQAYAKAFLDYLCAFDSPEALATHLDRHYTAKTETGRCLSYQPGTFTRLPNRYYTFRAGGIDFFALDSNTFNVPPPLPETEAGDRFRESLETRRQELEREKEAILTASAQVKGTSPDETEKLDDLRTKFSQVEEMKVDIDKQLASPESAIVDVEQLEWLRKSLIESWQTEGVRGRVLFFHHPPYVTEKTKWYQAQTLAVRLRLRRVLDEVSEAIGPLSQGRPIVDLVLNGHAHCFEHLQTLDTGHADANTNWIVCGGSGFSLRRQRVEGPELTEVFPLDGNMRSVARSTLFIGRNGYGSEKRRPYSFMRVDVQAGTPPKFRIRPFAVEMYRHEWQTHALKPFLV
ncbi:MAG: metallophosphoesterase [Leptolyngbyaceae cyanobacterium bins.59]|nr:metallophosphoesterase [Leptolyngbyaceae cyanobacterium bins.59]